MRLTALVLLSLVMYLAVLPCSDEVYADCIDTFETVSFENIREQGEKTHQDDSCSPFCTCNCSQTRSFVPLNSFETKLAVNIERNQLNPYEDFSPAGITDSIWRPPQYI